MTRQPGTTVSPSPRDLFAQLEDDEKIAVDLALGLLCAEFELGTKGTYDLDTDPRFVELVPDDARRGYLKTLARQLRLLGTSVGESGIFDEHQCEHRAHAERMRSDERQREAAAIREDVKRAEEQRRRDEALPPQVRKSVQRHRRRQQQRGAR